jgi:dTDP-4-dehydrorhamnose 3,5-epimerase
MRVTPLCLPEVLLVEPDVFTDSRGFFMETFHSGKYAEQGLPAVFLQDNHSRSVRGALRGLHYQLHQPQGKLMWVVRGEVFDVVVDIRQRSPGFGKWVGVVLSEENQRQIYIPPGFAHGFCTLSEEADFLYKCTELYAPGDEYGIAWDDPDIAVEWPQLDYLISDKDLGNPGLFGNENLPVCESR